MIFINALICAQMPYYSRYRRRTGFARYRRRYGYRRRRYARRSVTGGSLSSRSRVRVRVQVEKLITVEIPAKKTESSIVSSVPFANFSPLGTPTPGSLQCSATESPLYQTYIKLFDQVKCDGVISKVAVTTPVGSSNSSVPALTIVTAYDRQGTFYEAAQVGATQQGSLVSAPVTYSDVLESSGSVVRNALNNSVAKTARSCWASDIQERTMFHDCTLSTALNDNNDAAYASLRWSCPFFCPLFYVGFSLPTTAPTTATKINFILSQTYYFTFRNPKFGASSGASAAASKAAAVDPDDPLAVQSLDSEERVYVRSRSGYTPPRKQSRSSVAAMMEAGLDDPEDVTPHLLESLAERQEAMDDPDYVGNPKGIMDPMTDDERVDLQVNLRRGKQDADRWHARHDGETPLLSLPRGTTRVVPLPKN